MSDAGGLHPTHVPTATAPGTLRRSISVDSFVNPQQPRQQPATRSTGEHGLDLSDFEDDVSDDDDPLGEDYYGVDAAGDLTNFRRSRPTTSEPEDEELRRSRATSSASLSSRYESSNNSVQLPLPSRRKHTSPPPVPPLPAHVITTTSQQSSASQADFVVAVVGSPGCGKSTLINLALSQNGLSESTVGITIGPAGAGGRFEVVARQTAITLSSSSKDRSETAPRESLQIFEIETSSLDHVRLGVWPHGMPHIDGVLICYDASDATSFPEVPALLKGFYNMGLPTVLLACKSDMPRQLTPQTASEHSQRYNIGLIEVSIRSEKERKKMTQSFAWLCKAIARSRRMDLQQAGGAFRNPASPIYLHTAPWSDSREPKRQSRDQVHPFAVAASGSQRPTPVAVPPSGTPPTIGSPTRARSTNDLLADARRAAAAPTAPGPSSPRHNQSIANMSESRDEQPTAMDEDELIDDGEPPSQPSGLAPPTPAAPPPNPYLSLDELLDKLLFLAVSGDDATFISHFFLTFRRFASPRAVLLGMQKRLRALGSAPQDILLAKFAQMKICSVLEHWILHYPEDFATAGAAPALNALLKQLVMHIHTAHYGSELLPFLETIPTLRPKPNAWYKPIEDAPRIESDDESAAGVDSDDEPPALTRAATLGHTQSNSSVSNGLAGLSLAPPVSRERASSFPVQSTGATSAPPPASAHRSLPMVAQPPISMPPPPLPMSAASAMTNIKELQRISGHFQLLEPAAVAQEITRTMLNLFLKIEPRQWLHFISTTQRDPETDPVRKFNAFYNFLVSWVASIILSSDKLSKRAKIVVRFIDLARLLRTQHNYSGLRCIIAGIRMAAPGDEPAPGVLAFPLTHMLRERNADHEKILRSYETLLGSTQSHRAYRTALKHTDGPAIPEMEITTSDLNRANAGNQDNKEGDASRIHWGKFALMGRLVNNVTMFQNRCRTSPTLHVQDRHGLYQQLFPPSLVLMDDDMMMDRRGEASDELAPPIASTMEFAGAATNGGTSRPMRNAARKLFWW